MSYGYTLSDEEEFFCIACNYNPPACDDLCVQCEIKWYLDNPEEQDDLIEDFERNPKSLKAWYPVIVAIRKSRGES
jgi:hypothetical protein